MKCPNCSYNTFDYAESCKRCGSPLKVKPRYRVIYENREPGKPKITDKKESLSAETSEETSQQISQPELFSPPAPETEFDEPLQHEQEQQDLFDLDLAGLASRAVALLIDLVILLGVTTFTLATGLYFANSNLDLNSSNFMNLIVTVYLVLLFISSSYFIFLLGYGGRTIGKMVLGIRVIKTDGEPVGLREAIIRWVGYLVSAVFLFIGFIWALFDPRSQALHDKFAGTYVVRE